MLEVVLKPTAVVAVVAVPVKLPTKLEAVIIPVVLMLEVVLKPTAVVAVVAVPVKLPTKLEAVIIPVVSTLIIELTLLAVVAVPVKLPIKLEAVMIPTTLMLFAVKKPTVEIPSETFKLVTEAIPPITLVEVVAKEIVFVIFVPSPIAV
jgi:hypothetical protein